MRKYCVLRFTFQYVPTLKLEEPDLFFHSAFRNPNSKFHKRMENNRMEIIF